MKLKRMAWTVCAAVFCGSVLTASASTGAYEGVVTSVDGCEGGFDNGKHKAGEWRWYCNGWRYLYPGYHEVTLRKREAGYATDKIVVTLIMLSSLREPGRLQVPRRVMEKRRTSAKMAWLWPRLKTTHL